MSLEFWKSQIREFIVCISLLQDSEYFKVKDASELKVSTLVVREILQLLTLDFDTKVLEGMEEIGLMDLQVIIDKIHHVPTLKCLIQGKSSNVLVLESEESVVITSCLDCTIYVLGKVENMYISNCSNVTMYTSSCGVLWVDQVHSCDLKGVFKQLWIQNSLKTSLAIFSKLDSIIYNCSDLKISPIDFTWDGHGDDIHGLFVDDIGLQEGKWNSWISKDSINISILDPREFSSITLPFTKESQCQKKYSLKIPTEYAQSVDSQTQLLSSLREFINVQSHLHPDFLKDVETKMCEWLKKERLTEEYIKLSQEMP